ncbi:MAG: OmpH family outer membrane protein [Planctomycetota bacterium]
MNRLLVAFLVLCPSALATPAHAQAPAATTAAQAAPQKIAVGVIDFVKLFEAYPRVAEDRRQYDEFRKQRRTMFDDEKKKVEDLKLGLEIEKKNTANRAIKELEIQAMMSRLEGLQKILETEMRMKLEDLQVAWFEDAQRAIAIVAKERGISIVLRILADNGETTRDKVSIFEQRAVWYAGAEVDITPFVIRLLQVPLPPLIKEPQADTSKSAAPKADAAKDASAPKADAAKDASAPKADAAKQLGGK